MRKVYVCTQRDEDNGHLIALNSTVYVDPKIAKKEAEKLQKSYPQDGYKWDYELMFCDERINDNEHS